MIPDPRVDRQPSESERIPAPPRLVSAAPGSQNYLVDGQSPEYRGAGRSGPGSEHSRDRPGPGSVPTPGHCSDRGANVSAVEIDRRLVGHLRTRFAEVGTGTLRLVEANVLDVPVSDLVDPPFDVVANLPYHITSPVLHQLLGSEPRPERFVLMVQREVAERIAAKPGDMSYLSVFVQYHAEVRVARIVPASAFEPAPAVQSAILVGETRPRRLSEEAEEQLWRLVQAGFRERRKMLHNVLPRQLPQVGRERFERALEEVGIAADRRPQTVSVEEWMRLSDAVGPLD